MDVEQGINSAKIKMLPAAPEFYVSLFQTIHQVKLTLCYQIRNVILPSIPLFTLLTKCGSIASITSTTTATAGHALLIKDTFQPGCYIFKSVQYNFHVIHVSINAKIKQN